MSFTPWIIGLVVLIMLVVLMQRGSGDEMLKRQRREHEDTPARPPSVTSIDEAALRSDAQIRQLIEARKKIAAIKLVRQRTGLGLKEAKELVERL